MSGVSTRASSYGRASDHPHLGETSPCCPCCPCGMGAKLQLHVLQTPGLMGPQTPTTSEACAPAGRGWVWGAGPFSRPPQEGLEIGRPLVCQCGLPGAPDLPHQLGGRRAPRPRPLPPQLQTGAGAPRGGPATSPPSTATRMTSRGPATTSLRPRARMPRPPSACSYGEGQAGTSPGSSWSWGPLWSLCRRRSSPSRMWGRLQSRAGRLGPLGAAADCCHPAGSSACPTPATGSRSHPLARACGWWPSSWSWSWWSCGVRAPTSW